MEGPRRKRLKTSFVEESDGESGHPFQRCGTIKSITLKNFMCHDHLQVDFHPQINLIQGRNGSGKSAIQTAFVVGLGATARTTNRGKSMKELIKYNKNTATIQIEFANNGSDAYKQETFGDTIIVERKINLSGASTFQIKAKNGTVVSNKKEDMKRMCDYFNINVENPLTVLNQDMSRSFLSSTDPKNLYKFFLEVTQLQTMCDYYKQLSDALDSSRNLLRDREKCLPILEKEVTKENSRYQFCLKHKEKMKDLTNLRREIAWAKIIQQEKTCKAAEKDLQEIQKVIQRIEKAISDHSAKVDKGCEKNSELKNEYQNICKEIKNQNKFLQEQKLAVSKCSEKLKAAQREVDKLKRNIQTHQKEVDILKNAVKMDHSVTQKQWEDQHQNHLNKIQHLEAQVAEVNQNIKTEEAHMMNLQHTIKVKQEDLKQIGFEDMNNKKMKVDLQLELKNLQSQKTNAFTVFGQWVQPLLDKIENAHRQRQFKKKPIGPLGAYIEVLDSKWAHIAEKVIGGNVSAFCIDNQGDARVLEEIFRTVNFGDKEPTKIISRFRPQHDPALIAEKGVRSAEFQSLWSILKITNDAVANIVIDKYSVESILLIPTAEIAGRILKERNTVPQNCRLAYTLQGDRYYPDPNYRVYSGHGNQRTRFLQTSVEDKAQAVQSDILRLEDEKIRIQEEMGKFREECNRLKVQEKDSNQKLLRERTRARNLRIQLGELQGLDEPPPPNISQLEEDIRKEEAKLNATVEALTAAQERMNVAESEYKETGAAFNESAKSGSSKKDTAMKIEEEIKKYEDKERDLKRTEALLNQKLQNQQSKLAELERKLKEGQEKLQKETEAGNKILPRKETDKSPEELEKQYKYLEASLNREQELQGDPLEIMENYKKLREQFMRMNKEFKDHSFLVKKLEDSLEDRMYKGNQFRRLLAVWVKTSFKEALSIRNLVGKARFDFNNETLTLLVEKKSKGSRSDPVQLSSQDRNSSQQQLLSMMSGGERSFATVAFILALWEVIGSPVRILDEFDVFMDIIARRQSLDMMISAAKPNIQYIYLTPLEVNKNQYEGKLKFFRMPDPERNISE